MLWFCGLYGTLYGTLSEAAWSLRVASYSIASAVPINPNAVNSHTYAQLCNCWCYTSNCGMIAPFSVCGGTTPLPVSLQEYIKFSTKLECL